MRIISHEKGEKGTRCIVKLSKRGMRTRIWRSSWLNTGNDERNLYLAELQMLNRIEEAIETGKLPKL